MLFGRLMDKNIMFYDSKFYYYQSTIRILIALIIYIAIFVRPIDSPPPKLFFNGWICCFLWYYFIYIWIAPTKIQKMRVLGKKMWILWQIETKFWNLRKNCVITEKFITQSNLNLLNSVHLLLQTSSFY